MVTEEQFSKRPPTAQRRKESETADAQNNTCNTSARTEDVENQIRSLESQLRGDGLKHVNNLVDLINLIIPDKPSTPKAIHAARRSIKFVEHVPAPTIEAWLSARREQYAEILEKVVLKSTQTSCIEAAVAAAALTHVDVWRSVLRAAIPSRGKDVTHLIQHFVTRFGDLRLTALELLSAGVGSVQARLNILSSCYEPVNDFAREKVSPKDIRKSFTASWLAILREDLPPSTTQQILKKIPTELIPNMHDPLRLADFLTACYNDTSNVTVAILALEGLFLLVSKHKLDYPLFYPKLYALMTDEALFYATGREKFLELSATFLLKGGMLPGGMVAAFIKRLLRRSLMAPPDGALWCIRLALDLLHKHPATYYLVHRSVNLFDASITSGFKRNRAEMSDPFNDDEPNPQESRADESSLWELELLSRHVSPAVSRLVTAFSKDVRSNPLPPPGNLTDYIGLDFDDIFQAETKRKAKSSHLAYDVPGTAPGLAELHSRLSVGISWT